MHSMYMSVCLTSFFFNSRLSLTEWIKWDYICKADLGTVKLRSVMECWVICGKHNKNYDSSSHCRLPLVNKDYVIAKGKDKMNYNSWHLTFAKRKWDFSQPIAKVWISLLPNEVHTKNINGGNMTVPTFQAERPSQVIALPFEHNLGEDTQLTHHLFLSVTVRNGAWACCLRIWIRAPGGSYGPGSSQRDW